MTLAGKHLSIAIIARNEAAAIGRTLQSLAQQDLFGQQGIEIDLIVLANGCTDDTAGVAQTALTKCLGPALRRAEVVETPIGGKSRAWNMVVHDEAAADTDLFLFVDADVELAGPEVCRELLERLLADDQAVACSGRPVKRIARKQRKSLTDRISLEVSEANRADRSINGSLYCAWASALRQIWLPVPTPGEDGFLNAMIQTRGFSAPPDCCLVTQAERVTHYFDPPRLSQILAHEQRMVVGTAVNIWLFEHLMAMAPTEPVGRLIGERNATDPSWVGKVVRERTGTRRWVVPSKLLFWRMPRIQRDEPLRNLRRIPVGIIATAFSLVVAVFANSRLKQDSAAGYW